MSVIDELLISIGLDAKEFAKGVDAVRGKVENFATKAKEQFESVGTQSKDSGAVSALSFSRAGERVQKLGEASKEAAAAISDSFKGAAPAIELVRSKLGLLAATFGLVAGGAQTFSNYVDKSESLARLSTQLGVSVRELDAFGKAAEAAGGSAESMFASMKTYFQQTGRPAEEVFQLASKVEGMSRGAAQRFLQAQGVALDAIPIFLQGQKALDALMAKYRKTAFTAQDSRNARAFKVAWMDFKIAAQDVGNVFVRLVLPGVTKVLDGLSGLVGIIRENARAFALLAVGFGLVFGLKNLNAIKNAILAVRTFGMAVKMAALPVTVIAAGVAALVLAIDDLMGFAQGADSLLERMLKKMGAGSADIEELRESLKALGEGFSWLWDKVKPLLGGALTLVFKAVSVVIVGLVAAINGLVIGFNTLWQTAKKVGKGIASVFTAIPDAIIEALKTAWQTLTGWFDDAADLIKKKIGEPIKGLFGGIGKFLGFSGDKAADEEKNQPTSTREREIVVVKQAAYKAAAPNVVTNASMNVVNNIETRDNAQAISRAIGATVTGGFNRQAELIGQSTRGVNLK
nr:MAG TPA: tail tape measure [Caudoviricetes sp.]